MLSTSSCLRDGQELKLESVDEADRKLLLLYYPTAFADILAGHLNRQEIEGVVYRMAAKPAVKTSPRAGYSRKEWTERFVTELHKLPIVSMISESCDVQLIDELHRIIFQSFKDQEVSKSKDNPGVGEFWDANLSHLEQWRLSHG